MYIYKYICYMFWCVRTHFTMSSLTYYLFCNFYSIYSKIKW